MTEDDPPQGSQDPAVKASDVAKLLEKSQVRSLLPRARCCSAALSDLCAAPLAAG